MKLVMMRHGATASNAQRRYIGINNDEALSEEGRAQCLCAGCFPAVSQVYTSPLLRARQTASICFPQAAIEVVAGLEEYDFGMFEGHNAEEMADWAAYRSWVDGNCMGTCPGGESRETYLQRTNSALLSVLEAARKRDEQQVIIVAHGGTIMAAFSTFAIAEETQDYFAWQVKPACGYSAHVEFDGNLVQLRSCTPFETLPL